MKKTLLLLTMYLSVCSMQAQTKSTGVVTLPVSGMTAKLDLNNSNSTATLTLSGPSDRWFALQFGEFVSGDGMSAGEDVVYYNGTTLIDAVHNGIGSAPSTDTNNWTVTSNTTNLGTRTIVATRAFNTGNANDFTFVYANSTIDFACAKMGSASFTLAYHGGTNRGYAIDVPINTALSTNEFSWKKALSIYPNPSSSSFNLQTEEIIKTVTIYDATGNKVASFENPNKSLDFSTFAEGVYFAEIRNNNNETVIKKMVKSNQAKNFLKP